MAFTYDPTTDLGRVRLLISDTATDDVSLQLYQDAELDAFLAMNNGVKRAAAAALVAIAGNIAQVDRVVRTQDLQTDGAKTAEALRALAKSLRDEADRDDDDGDDGNLVLVDFDKYAAYRRRY